MGKPQDLRKQYEGESWYAKAMNSLMNGIKLHSIQITKQTHWSPFEPLINQFFAAPHTI